jgi:hypothetical protein
MLNSVLIVIAYSLFEFDIPLPREKDIFQIRLQ